VNLARGHWRFIGEVLDGSAWSTRSERGYGPLVRLRYGMNYTKLRSSSSLITRWW